MIPLDEQHRDFGPAKTVKSHVDAAIKLALTGDQGQEALERLILAGKALHGVRSVRVSSSWHGAIVRTQMAIVGAYELAA